MLFTKTPGDCTPLYGAIVFAFGDQEAPRDLEVELYDDRSNQLLFTKRFSRTNCGEINVAPLLRSLVRWEPETRETGFEGAAGRELRIRVVVEDAVATCTVVPTLPDVEHPDVLFTTLPTSRVLVRGESEELFLAGSVGRAELLLYTPWEKKHSLYRAPMGSDMRLFHLNSSEWPEGVCHAELRIFNLVGQEQATIHYTLIEPTKESLRVAWVSSLGSIEHYTFPVVDEVMLLDQQEALTLADGSCRRLKARYGWRQRLTSAYEQREVIGALAEITTSPQIWWVDDRGLYHPVSALPEPLTVARRGTISTLQLTLCSPVKQLSLWS